MPGTETERRETEAVRDIAATALYHANRLPIDSEWGELFRGLGDALASECRLSPVSPPDPEQQAAARGRGHLQVVV